MSKDSSAPRKGGLPRSKKTPPPLARFFRLGNALAERRELASAAASYRKAASLAPDRRVRCSPRSKYGLSSEHVGPNHLGFLRPRADLQAVAEAAEARAEETAAWEGEGGGTWARPGSAKGGVASRSTQRAAEKERAKVRALEQSAIYLAHPTRWGNPGLRSDSGSSMLSHPARRRLRGGSGSGGRRRPRR